MDSHTTTHTPTLSYYHRWLTLQGRSLNSASKGCLIASIPIDSNSTEAPSQVYFWPDQVDDTGDLTRLCKRVENEDKGIILSFKEKHEGKDTAYSSAHIGYTLAINEHLRLTCAFQIHPKDERELHLSMHHLEWGLRRCKEELLLGITDGLTTENHTKNILRIVDQVQSRKHFKESSQELVNALAKKYSSSRVSFGYYKNNNARIIAISTQTNLDVNSPLVRDLALAMEECFDQNEEILFPSQANTPGPISRFHEKLTTTYNSNGAVSFPIVDANLENQFVLLIEHNPPQSFPPEELQAYRTVAKTVGPILAAKQLQEYGLTTLLALKVKKTFKKFASNSRASWFKGTFALCLLFFCFFVKGDFRVAADVTLSGTILRSIVAPFPGYVARADKSRGDHVEQGETLAMLDTSDLTLEELTWTSKYTQADLEHRKAVAENATSQAKIIDEQKKQAKIHLALLHLQKERANIQAPFSGVIVSGDLSQSVGGPVERGKLLFEMVPDNGYKLIAQVDEKDISFVTNKQKGSLVFNSLPKEKFHFIISKITPVSTAAEGKNSFLVEATLSSDSKSLRPGMKGYAKIIVGSKPLIWLWTRSLRDRLRILAWTMLPW